jgi:hypothetical protein
MKLYLASDLVQLSVEKEVAHEDGLAHMEAVRGGQLKKRGIDAALDTLSVDWQTAILGDFLSSENKKPKTGIMAVQRHLTAAEKIRRLPEPFCFRTDLVDTFVHWKTLDGLEVIGAALLHRELVFRALQVENICIVSFLDDKSRKSLAKAFPSEKHLKFGREFATRTLRDILTHHNCTIDFPAIRSKYRAAMVRVEDHPFHGEVGVQATFKRIVDILETDVEEGRRTRKTLLVETLRRWNLEFRDDSRFCAEYIEGKTLVSVEEIGATMYVTNMLFKVYGNPGWEEVVSEMEEYMRTLRFHHGLSWKDACRKASSSPRLNNAAKRSVERASRSYDRYDSDW